MQHATIIVNCEEVHALGKTTRTRCACTYVHTSLEVCDRERTAWHSTAQYRTTLHGAVTLRYSPELNRPGGFVWFCCDYIRTYLVCTHVPFTYYDTWYLVCTKDKQHDIAVHSTEPRSRAQHASSALGSALRACAALVRWAELRYILS